MNIHEAAKLDPRIVHLYATRPNKKDSFKRWYKRFRTNFVGWERCINAN